VLKQQGFYYKDKFFRPGHSFESQHHNNQLGYCTVNKLFVTFVGNLPHLWALCKVYITAPDTVKQLGTTSYKKLVTPASPTKIVPVGWGTHKVTLFAIMT
jgi:hypothetical protein